MKQKTVLITGASSGFGKATAELLIEQGHKLILVARRAEKLDAIKKLSPGNIHTLVVDVTKKEEIKKLFATLPDKFKDIDVVINNAGLALGFDPIEEIDLDDWDRMVDTNIKGLIYMTKIAVDYMKGSRGLIINIGSMAAEVPYKGGNVYGATKAFVRHFSRNLRTDLFGNNIKVTNIEPGAAETEFSIVRFKDEIKAKDYYKGWRPLKAIDIANTILWVMNQPEHVNIENIEIMSIDQVYAGMVINKK